MPTPRDVALYNRMNAVYDHLDALIAEAENARGMMRDAGYAGEQDELETRLYDALDTVVGFMPGLEMRANEEQIIG